jgi:hypothetical protein
MSRLFAPSARALVAAVIVVIVVAGPANEQARAGAQDYVFEVVDRQVVLGTNHATIAVRLVHKPSGKPVANAVIFDSALDMSGHGMAGHGAKPTPLPVQEPGIYRFQAEITMAGEWVLHLAAKVPGEQETVRGKVVFSATSG